MALNGVVRLLLGMGVDVNEKRPEPYSSTRDKEPFGCLVD